MVKFSLSKVKTLIGPTEMLGFPELGLKKVPARIDTGAKTSAIWASDVKEENGVLSFKLFDETHDLHDGKLIKINHFKVRPVTSSNGFTEERYVVRLLVKISDRRVRASFTLANRSTQKYPVLIGRNVLRGKFVVDVQKNNSISNPAASPNEGLKNEAKEQS